MEIKALETELKSFLEKLGYSLVSLSFTSSKDGKNLNIVVDRVEPINMDDIVELTHSVSSLLDELNPIDCAYTVDLSSLGAEKPLDVNNLSPYIGRFIHVHLINPIEGENIFEGTLEADSEELIKLSYRIKTRTKLVDITKSNISKIRLAIKF